MIHSCCLMVSWSRNKTFSRTSEHHLTEKRIFRQEYRPLILHYDPSFLVNAKAFSLAIAASANKEKPLHVWHLNKAIYGLKQAPRAWFDKFSTFFFIKFGLCCPKFDHSLFIYKTEKDIITLMLYVDDMVITINSSEPFSKLLRELNKEFRMKDMGRLHYFLGIHVQSWERVFCVNKNTQKTYFSGIHDWMYSHAYTSSPTAQHDKRSVRVILKFYLLQKSSM